LLCPVTTLVIQALKHPILHSPRSNMMEDFIAPTTTKPDVRNKTAPIDIPTTRKPEAPTRAPARKPFNFDDLFEGVDPDYLKEIDEDIEEMMKKPLTQEEKADMEDYESDFDDDYEGDDPPEPPRSVVNPTIPGRVTCDLPKDWFMDTPSISHTYVSSFLSIHY
jgi:hypothetical protein